MSNSPHDLNHITSPPPDTVYSCSNNQTNACASILQTSCQFI